VLGSKARWIVPVVALVACGGDDDDDNDATGSEPERIAVVASFYPVAEAAEQVGGDRVEVTNLTPAGTEPHDLELTPDQVVDLEDADVVLYVGAGFQPAVAEIAEDRDGASLDLAAGIDLQAGDIEALEAQEEASGEHEDEGGEEGEETEEEHAEGELDPHFWLDPTLLAAAVDEVAAALGEASPDDAATFEANAQAYKDDLADLDAAYESGLGSCQRDEIVTSHAAFFYLADRYGLRQLPVMGLSPEAEPDPARLAELAQEIESGGITTVFYETLVAPDVAETLANEAGVETAVLNPLEGLTDDQVEAGDDYQSVMRDNLSALRAALDCT